MITDKEIQEAAEEKYPIHFSTGKRSHAKLVDLQDAQRRGFITGVNSHIAKQKWGPSRLVAKIAELEERVKELETSNREKQTIIEIIRGEYP